MPREHYSRKKLSTGEDAIARMRRIVEEDVKKRGRPALPGRINNLLSDVEVALDRAEEKDDLQLASALATRHEHLLAELEKSMAFWGPKLGEGQTRQRVSPHPAGKAGEAPKRPVAKRSKPAGRIYSGFTGTPRPTVEVQRAINSARESYLQAVGEGNGTLAYALKETLRNLKAELSASVRMRQKEGPASET